MVYEVLDSAASFWPISYGEAGQGGGMDFERFSAGVAEFERFFFGGGGGLLDLHAVLVGAGAHQRAAALKLLPALDHVCEDHGVEMADMGVCEASGRRIERSQRCPPALT